MASSWIDLCSNCLPNLNCLFHLAWNSHANYFKQTIDPKYSKSKILPNRTGLKVALETRHSFSVATKDTIGLPMQQADVIIWQIGIVFVYGNTS